MSFLSVNTEFFLGFNTIVAMTAVILCYLWCYYSREIKTIMKKENEPADLEKALSVIDSMDDDTLAIVVGEMEHIIADLYLEQDRRSQTIFG